MSSLLILIIILSYFSLILVISQFTGRKASNETFFLGNRNSPWYVVAFGMIGASLSGVTFISVPGWVGDSQFSYMQMVIGYPLGYFFIVMVLLPVYYRLNLTSIYTYLEGRFGRFAYKTGASFFLLSRILGASFRLYLVSAVLHLSVFSHWGVPFWVTVVIAILLIWLYTYRGGIRTIIWTDTLQTFFLLATMLMTLVLLSRSMGLDFGGMVGKIADSGYSKMFFFDDWRSEHNFFKQFFSGAFIAITMTGLDQDMMQKNLSCRNLRESRKNMIWMSLSLLPVNFLFMCLGALLYIFAARMSIELPGRSDDLFPLIATGGYLPPLVGILFIVGLIAAAYSSADSALTSLTTSFTVDILKGKRLPEDKLQTLRKRVHLGISAALLLCILLIRVINNESVISAIMRVAGYTYGPLLGLFIFGLFTKWKVRDRWVPFIAVGSPMVSYILSANSVQWFNGYQFGFELLILNGLLTFGGLFLARRK